MLAPPSRNSPRNPADRYATLRLVHQDGGGGSGGPDSTVSPPGRTATTNAVLRIPSSGNRVATPTTSTVLPGSAGGFGSGSPPRDSSSTAVNVSPSATTVSVIHSPCRPAS